MRKLALVLVLVCAGILVPRIASAQIHWDASAQLGVMKRFLGDKPPQGEDTGFGPTGQLTAHLALLPLIHAGAYLGHDISPSPGDTARNITWTGLRAKANLPIGTTKIRAWAFAGFGIALVYQQSVQRTLNVPLPGTTQSQAREVTIQGAGGRFFEIPFGVGASYKLRKPWELCAELGARFGLAHGGSVYEQGAQITAPGIINQNAQPFGVDRFALGLTVGIMLDL